MKYKKSRTGFYRKITPFPEGPGMLWPMLISILILTSCTNENAPDCIQSAGKMVRMEVDVVDFTSITVFENLNLVLKQGAETEVELESGEFLINEISARVIDDRLILENNNGCNFFRDYGISTVYVTSPNITEVRSGTGLLVSSDGILNYPDLTLISESFNNPETETTDGSFDLQVNVQALNIVVNGIAFFGLRGQVENLSINVAAGDSRIEAENLVAENVRIDHRGSNDVFVNPQQRISGIIRGYGDVISFNRPPEVDVNEIFNGRLIFRE